jgi:hypothetical protein
MNKVIKNVNLVAIIFILITINACTKENKDSLVSNDNISSIHELKWNPDEGYPFIVKDNPPFEYAVYQKDEKMLSEYIKSVLEEQEKILEEEQGYFILSFKEQFINYGFLTKINPYYHQYNPDIPDDPGNGNGIVCLSYREFNNFETAWAYAKEQAKAGYSVSLTFYKTGPGGTRPFWSVHVDDGLD